MEPWQGQAREVGLASGFQCQRCGQGGKRRPFPADSPPPPAPALSLSHPALLHSHPLPALGSNLKLAPTAYNTCPLKNLAYRQGTRTDSTIWIAFLEAKMFVRKRENTAQRTGSWQRVAYRLPFAFASLGPTPASPWSAQKQVAGRCTSALSALEADATSLFLAGFLAFCGLS